MPQFTQEQTEFAAAVADFCKREVGTRERRDELTDGGTKPHSPELYKKMCDLGWAGIILDEAYGGGGGGHVEMCIFLEEAIRGGAPISAAGTTMIAALAYQRFASEEIKQRVLSGTAAGDVLSISMSEPGAGSDVGALSCFAEKVDGGWKINGQKTWCSNAHIAASILLIARTDKSGKKHEGITQFFVPTDTPGLQISPIDTLGGKEVNDLYFTDCFLPDSAVVGTVGNGWTQLMSGLNTERLIVGALQVGLAERSFEYTLDYIKNREQFGRPIGSFQALRHRMADHATDITCAKELVYSMAHEADAHPDKMFAREASMVKLKTTEVAKTMAIDSMQMMGGYGYSTEFEAERIMRSAIIGTVVGGASEVQRDIISKTYGL
ncbi:acyl-CoA dehydrogenase family protein [Jongsikchunia kroppenstedtii]|uniref:acyl-CoA dehydrogenase family protein n=1 Tax=Jongsikchunia kroppenstedtii TaxID=1121721 RepID=UPI0003642811|nr:acyl-CoA dehydrogenase family protein [Jongsikchunia kroppenstedtii]